MKITMLDNLATPTVGYSMGREYDVPDEYGRQLVGKGLAKPSTAGATTDAVTGDTSYGPPATRQTLDQTPGLIAEAIRPSAADVPAAGVIATTPGEAKPTETNGDATKAAADVVASRRGR